MQSNNLQVVQQNASSNRDGESQYSAQTGFTGYTMG